MHDEGVGLNPAQCEEKMAGRHLGGMVWLAPQECHELRAETLAIRWVSSLKTILLGFFFFFLFCFVLFPPLPPPKKKFGFFILPKTSSFWFWHRLGINSACLFKKYDI